MYVCVCVCDQRVQDKVLHLQSVYSPWSALSLRQTAVICLKREKKKLFEGITVLRNWCNALMKKWERAQKSPYKSDHNYCTATVIILGWRATVSVVCSVDLLERIKPIMWELAWTAA